MEPRPQSSRPAHDQGQHRQGPPGNPEGTGDTGNMSQQPDPTSVVAPPRADYDYSPLDLAPPGQRRRRQMVAAGLGGLVMLLLVAAVIFAFFVVREDDPDGEGNNIAAAQTEVALDRATVSAQETIVASAAGGTETPGDDPEAAGGEVTATSAGEESAGSAGNAAQPGATTSVNEGGNEAAVEPTPAEGGSGGGAGAPGEGDLQALLPDESAMPQGLVVGEDTTRTEAEVVDSLGGNREAETNLQNWGWTANVERSFEPANAEELGPEATSQIVVSLHGFSSEEAATEALTFYSDILVEDFGYQEEEAGDIGTTNRLLVQPQQEGGTNVALYVQEGAVLYRIGGYSAGGDPTSDVLDVAQAMLSS